MQLLYMSFSQILEKTDNTDIWPVNQKNFLLTYKNKSGV